MIKKSTILGIIVALVISIAAIGCSSSSETKPTTTATPTQTSAPTATITQDINGAATATSLDFTVQVTTQSVVSTCRYRARNIGTSSLDIRVDVSSQQMNSAYIISGSNRQGWIYSDGQWINFTTMYQGFDEYWNTWNGSFAGYRTSLAKNWTGLQGWTYTVPGVGTVTYTDITINPTLPDSLFQPN